jgi:hypothetical protein
MFACCVGAGVAAHAPRGGGERLEAMLTSRPPSTDWSAEKSRNVTARVFEICRGQGWGGGLRRRYENLTCRKQFRRKQYTHAEQRATAAGKPSLPARPQLLRVPSASVAGSDGRAACERTLTVLSTDLSAGRATDWMDKDPNVSTIWTWAARLDNLK